MFQHLAMEQPQAWIVSYKNKSNSAACGYQPRITFARRSISRGVVHQYPKMVTMQMHGMWPSGVIKNVKCDDLPKLDIGKRLTVITNTSIESQKFLCSRAKVFSDKLSPLKIASVKLPIAPPCICTAITFAVLRSALIGGVARLIAVLLILLDQALDPRRRVQLDRVRRCLPSLELYGHDRYQ